MFLSILLASACSALPAQKAASTSVPTTTDLFPAPSAGLQVAIGEGTDMKLPKLLEEFSKVTGVALLMDAETRVEVAKCSTGLNRSLDVPAAEVYPVVETILLHNGFGLVPVHDRDPRIASVVSTSGNRGGLRGSAVFVSARDLEVYSRHPAVFVTTIVDMPHTDVRTLSNSMRTMFTDANTQQVIPVGNTNTLILTGFAGNLANVVRMLQVAEESSARASEEEAQRRLEEDARRAEIQARHGGPPPPPAESQPKDKKPE